MRTQTVTRNTIYVDLGLFEAAESLGARTSVANAKALLAGVIGHELAHIFFRHHGDRSRGLWGELTGALPIDRKQEQQADVLGTFLACQAGYGPEGLANFMRLLISQKGNSSDFGSTHPNSRGRIAMIEQVARGCPTTGR
ncbi:MAG: M48 family metalloprotease [Pyrinomonadaceae bacterium]